MLLRTYLTGLDADDFDIPGVFGVRHARAPGSWRILTTYADGKKHKGRLFANMAQAGQREARRSWDFHHVVEGQHYADIDFAGRLERLYTRVLPCVLVAKEEHLAYNRVLHIRETDELFRDLGMPDDMRKRAGETAELARDPKRHNELRGRVKQLRNLYRGAYQGDHVLTAVANNVLNEALTQLR